MLEMPAILQAPRPESRHRKERNPPTVTLMNYLERADNLGFLRPE